MKSALLVAVSVLAISGCANKNVDSLEAVKQGVIADLAKSKNLTLDSMDVSVVSVQFRDKEADAVVSFTAKGTPPGSGLTMKYTMQRDGSQWHIKARAQSDLQKHAAQAPPAAMQGGENPHGSGGSLPLPEGHGQGQSNLPAGHPPLDSRQ